MEEKQIHALIEKFEDSRLTELSLESGDGFKLTLKSETQQVVVAAGQATPSIQAAPPAPSASTETPAPAGAPAEGVEIISSPIVGTFYRSPAPDAPAFVEEGSTVKEGDSLCIIEAMKIMNKLEAEYPCEIVKILVESGAMVEYGAPLFEVKRA